MSKGRILLGQKIAFVGTHGGANKANRALLTGLAANGWDCRAIVATRPMHKEAWDSGLVGELDARRIHYERDGAILRFTLDNVSVHAVAEDSGTHYGRANRLLTYFGEQIERFSPDCVMVAGEDHGQRLLRTAADLVPDRTICLARSSAMLGIGPLAFFPSPNAAELFQRIAGVIVNSHYLRSYLRQWAHIDSFVLDVPTYRGPSPEWVPNESGLVLMINPCAVKGIDIFVRLAGAFPEIRFGAIPTWGTTAADLASLSQCGNVRLLSATDDEQTIYRTTRVLVVPSLWDESFGRIVIEAMSYGIPTLASSVGGLPEAKLGVPYVLPVKPITGYHPRLDDRHVALAIAPAQDISQWKAVLETLLFDRGLYRAVSYDSWLAASSYIRSLSVSNIEGTILSMISSPRVTVDRPPTSRVATKGHNQ